MALILEVLLIQGASKEEGGLCDLGMLLTHDEIANIKILIASFNATQTWNLSKILHTQIFRLKVLHRKSA